MQLDVLDQILNATGPCVTLSLNTHRTHPDNLTDALVLKNLCKEARERLLAQYGEKESQPLIDEMTRLVQDVDVNYNLDSLHILVSPSFSDVVRSPFPTNEDKVEIAEHFSIRPLIKTLRYAQSYLVMMLSQSGVHLYHAMNEEVNYEVTEAGFPFAENPYYLPVTGKMSYPKEADPTVTQFLNEVDKALVHVHHSTGLKTVVICTADNYSRLMEVANRPDVYLGHAPINYDDTGRNALARQAWAVVQKKLEGDDAAAVRSVQAAVGQGKVYTDLGEIFKAANEGRAELLVAAADFRQPARRLDETTIELADDSREDGVLGDVVDEIAMLTLAMRGRVVFTQGEELDGLGPVALKVRY